jgi:hypothetical protein
MTSWRTIIVVLAVVVLAAVVAWRLDAAHRQSCINQGRTDCSWLPWQEGGAGGASGPSPGPAVGVENGVGSPVSGGSVSGVGSSVSSKVGSGASQLP